MEGPDDRRLCGTAPEPADEPGASRGSHVGRPPRSRPLRHACLARRGPPGMAGHAAPFPAAMGPRHLRLPLRQRSSAPAPPAGPGLVVSALRGPCEHGHGGVCGHPGSAGHHRPRPRLHAPGGKTRLPANQETEKRPGRPFHGGNSRPRVNGHRPAEDCRMRQPPAEPVTSRSLQKYSRSFPSSRSGQGPSPAS